jgi:hypothetical protein
MFKHIKSSDDNSPSPWGEGRGEGDSRHLGSAEKNLAGPKVAEQPSERRERSQSFERGYSAPVHGEGGLFPAEVRGSI